MTRIRQIDKTSKRTPRVIYTEGEDQIKENMIFVDPETGNTMKNYDSDGVLGTNASYPGCTNTANLPANSVIRRYCHITWALKNYYKTKYTYYQGHKKSINQVIQEKEGNCCDLSRLVDKIASDNLICIRECGAPVTTRRYVLVDITVGGNDYTHLYNELYINNEWMILDATNYLLNGSARNVYGTVKGVIGRIDSADGTPCD